MIIKGWRRNVQCFKRIKYCLGNGLELLSASVVIAVCHDSRVFRTKPYNRNFLHQNSGHLSIFKPTLFIRSLATIARGTTLVKQGDVFPVGKKKHIRKVKSCSRGSNISYHAWSNNHSIDFKNAAVIDKGDYRVRKTLEPWHTAMTTDLTIFNSFETLSIPSSAFYYHS